MRSVEVRESQLPVTFALLLAKEPWVLIVTGPNVSRVTTVWSLLNMPFNVHVRSTGLLVVSDAQLTAPGCCLQDSE